MKEGVNSLVLFSFLLTFLLTLSRACAIIASRPLGRYFYVFESDDVCQGCPYFHHSNRFWEDAFVVKGMRKAGAVSASCLPTVLCEEREARHTRSRRVVSLRLFDVTHELEN